MYHAHSTRVNAKTEEKLFSAEAEALRKKSRARWSKRSSYEAREDR
jgi:hypothetical protein